LRHKSGKTSRKQEAEKQFSNHLTIFEKAKVIEKATGVFFSGF
jgi:hypothetical protein